jgi:hypothetical protein
MERARDSNSIFPEALGAASVLVAWAACLVFFVPLGLPLFVLALLGFLVRKKAKNALLITLVSPFLVVPIGSMVAAVVGYERGSAHYLTVGMPSYEVGALDRESGQPMRSTGCMLTGLEVLHNMPNNATLRFLARQLGKPKPVYFVPLSAKAVLLSAETWRVQHAEDERCPTGALLSEERLVDARSTFDPWGKPFQIRCVGDETFVLSDGPDLVAGTEDDICTPGPCSGSP